MYVHRLHHLKLIVLLKHKFTKLYIKPLNHKQSLPLCVQLANCYQD